MGADCGCPDAAELQRLLASGPTLEVDAWLVTHVASCNACQQALESLADGDTEEIPHVLRMARDLRRPQGLEQAIHALKNEPLTVAEHGTFEVAADSALVILRASAAPESLGRLGPFEVTEVLGRGGFGVVFKAFDATLHRPVALKVLAPHLAHSAAARQRFAREARAAAAVRHAHVVAIHGVDEADGLPYLVMEYIAGESLQERLDRDGPLDLAEVLRIGMQIAAGLAAAHAQGLVHRDVKPANILLDGNVEHVKITDFGLARAADDASLTQSGVLAGTPQYMAPEQACSAPLDHRADLFSLGSVLYAMSTGRPPFRAATTFALLRRICDEPARPIREIIPSAPAWLDEIIGILHAKDRTERFQSAAEVATVLGTFLAYLQQPGPRPRLPARLRTPAQRRTARRRRWIGGIAVLSVFALGALALAGAYLSLEANRDPEPPRVALAPDGEALDEAEAGPFMNVTFNAARNLMALACQQGKCAQIWDVRAGRKRQDLRGHTSAVWSVAFSPDGRRLATAAGNWNIDDEPGEVWLWDILTGERLCRFVGHTKGALTVAIAPDGTTVASAGLDGSVRLWDVETGRARAVFHGHHALVRSVAFSPDGKTLASGSFDGTVRLLDAASGNEKACLRTALWGVNRVAFSPDGTALAAAELGVRPENRDARRVNTPHEGHSDGQVELWDLSTQAVRRVLRGPAGCVLGVAFAPNGKTIAAAGGMWGEFGEVTLWDLASGAMTVEHLPAWAECVAFAPDGNTLVSAGGVSNQLPSAQVHCWDLMPTATGPPALRPAALFTQSPLGFAGRAAAP